MTPDEERVAQALEEALTSAFRVELLATARKHGATSEGQADKIVAFAIRSARLRVSSFKPVTYQSLGGCPLRHFLKDHVVRWVKIFKRFKDDPCVLNHGPGLPILRPADEWEDKDVDKLLLALNRKWGSGLVNRGVSKLVDAARGHVHSDANLEEVRTQFLDAVETSRFRTYDPALYGNVKCPMCSILFSITHRKATDVWTRREKPAKLKSLPWELVGPASKLLVAASTPTGFNVITLHNGFRLNVTNISYDTVVRVSVHLGKKTKEGARRTAKSRALKTIRARSRQMWLIEEDPSVIDRCIRLTSDHLRVLRGYFDRNKGEWQYPKIDLQQEWHVKIRARKEGWKTDPEILGKALDLIELARLTPPRVRQLRGDP